MKYLQQAERTDEDLWQSSSRTNISIDTIGLSIHFMLLLCSERERSVPIEVASTRYCSVGYHLAAGSFVFVPEV